MKKYIAYTNKSCITGKALRISLQALRKRTQRRAKAEFFLRWGNTDDFPVRGLELNTLAAVRRTVDKKLMLETLAAAGIPVPQFNSDPSLVAEHLDESGNLYIRNKLGVVRYANDFSQVSDAYYSKPVVDKRREYRVHVFNGKVIGLYEKVPMEEGRPKLYKSHNCNFKRCDPSISRLDQEKQSICIRAVQALGLLFGGVDCMRLKGGDIVISEVNSAPGLNTQMIGVYTNAIQEYVNSTMDSTPV